MLKLGDLKKHKALAEQIISNCTFCLQKIEKYCTMLAEKLYELEQKLQKLENEVELNIYFAESEKLRNSLLSLLIAKDKIYELINRNNSRLNEIKKQIALDDDGVEPSHKAIDAMLDSKSINVNEDTLGFSADSIQLKLYKNTLFKMKNNKLDMSSEENLEAIKNLNFEDLKNIIFIYPSIVSQIEEKQLIEASFRIKLLKVIATYVFDKIESKTLLEINSDFCGLLSFKYKIANSAEEYIREIENLYRVKISNYLAQKYPNKKSDIYKKLKPNVHSKFLPEEFYEEEKIENSPQTGASDLDAEIEEFIKSILEDKK